MVKKLCVTIPEELDTAINMVCCAVEEHIKMPVNKSRVVTLLLEAGINASFPSMSKEKKGEQNGH